VKQKNVIRWRVTCPRCNAPLPEGSLDQDAKRFGHMLRHLIAFSNMTDRKITIVKGLLDYFNASTGNEPLLRGFLGLVDGVDLRLQIVDGFSRERPLNFPLLPPDLVFHIDEAEGTLTLTKNQQKETVRMLERLLDILRAEEGLEQ